MGNGNHHPLAQKWRQEADQNERRGLKEVANFARSFADELDIYERERGLETLSLSQAAVESGRHPDTIARYIADGELENVGKKGSPLVRRGDLVERLKKPTHRKKTPRPTSGEPDLNARVKAAQTTQLTTPA